MKSKQAGVTLVELMIVVAVIAVIAGIAIPAYNGYLSESYLATARANAGPLQIALEDWRLDNGSYTAANGKQWDPSGTKDTTDINWKPDGDNNDYKYVVTVATASGYTFTVTHVASGKSVTCSKASNTCQ